MPNTTEKTELTALEEYLNWLQTTKQAKSVRRALSALCTTIQTYYKKNSYGEYPALDQKECETLRNAYDTCIQTCEKEKNSVRLLPQILEIMRNDLEAIRYDDFSINSLPEMLAAARTQVVSMTDLENVVQNVGGNMSSRIPVTYQSRAGKEITGYFTKTTAYQSKERFEKILGNLMDACPLEKRETLTTFLTHPEFQRVFLNEDVKQFSKSRDLLSNCQKFFQGELTNRFIKPRLQTIMRKMGLPQMYLEDLYQEGNARLNEAMAEFFGACNMFLNQNMIYNEAGIQLGSNIDQRNCAMSAMATLLGRPELLAQSRPMTLVQNGTAVKGIFMESAKGMDVNHLRQQELIAIKDRKLSMTPTEILPKLADLQVLDYICGNTDRHIGNLLYQFKEQNETLKLVNITGIDNDNSFGTITNAKARMTSPDEMLVLPASTGRKVLELDQAKLYLTLKPFGLSEAELSAAWTRTQQVQEKIKLGLTAFRDKRQEERISVQEDCIRLLEDDQWRKLNAKDLIHRKTRGTYKNMFLQVDVLCKDFLQRRAREANLAPEDEQKEPEVREFNRAEDMGPLSAFGMAPAKEKLSAIAERFLTVGAADGGSREFMAMYTAFQTLQQAAESKEAETVKTAFEAAARATQDYIAAKGKNPFTQRGKNRLDVAKELYSLCAVQKEQIRSYQASAENRKAAEKREEVIGSYTAGLCAELAQNQSDETATIWDEQALAAQRDLVKLGLSLKDGAVLSPKWRERAYRDMAMLTAYERSRNEIEDNLGLAQNASDCRDRAYELLMGLKGREALPQPEELTAAALLKFVTERQEKQLADGQSIRQKQAEKQSDAVVKNPQKGGRSK